MSEAQTPATPEATVIVIAPRAKIVEQAAVSFRDKRPEPLIEVPGVAEATAKAQTVPCVLIYSLMGEADIAPCMQLCLTLGLEKPNSPRRMIVVSKMDNTKLRGALRNKGVSEFLSDRSSVQAIVFKATLLLKHVQKVVEQPAEQKQKRNRGQAQREPTHQTTEEILQDDTWLIKGVAPRKVGIKWVIECTGVDPDSGSWEPVENNEARSEQWCWRALDDEGKHPAPSAGQTVWVFTGNRPTFDTKSEKWKFVGKNPELNGWKDSKRTGSRIKYANGIVFTKDSPDAAVRIQKSIVIGEKVRKERERETVEKAKADRGTEVIRSSQSESTDPGTFVAKGEANNHPGVVVQEGNKSQTHSGTEDRQGHQFHARAGSADRVPNSEFGDADGEWEQVPNQGWAFVTPEIEKANPDELEEQAPFYYVDEDSARAKPKFDKKADSWAFHPDHPPQKADTFEELPAPYQKHFEESCQAPIAKHSATQAGAKVDNKSSHGSSTSDKSPNGQNSLTANGSAPAASNNSLANSAAGAPTAHNNSLTNSAPHAPSAQKSQSASDTAQGAPGVLGAQTAAERAKAVLKPERHQPMSPLQYFFFISEMINAGKNEHEIFAEIIKSTRKILALEDLLIIEPVSGGGKRNAVVVSSTRSDFQKGQTIDLEKMTFQDALTDLEPRTYDLPAEKCVGTYPIINPTPAPVSHGCLILFFPKSQRINIGKHNVFLNGVTKQLLRILSDSQLHQNAA